MTNNDAYILDKIMDILGGNGEVTREMRDRLMLEALAEVIRTTRANNVVAVFKKNWIKNSLIVTFCFVALHELATYLGFHFLLGVLLNALGVPLPP